MRRLVAVAAAAGALTIAGCTAGSPAGPDSPSPSAPGSASSSAGSGSALRWRPCTEQGDNCQLLVTHDTSSEGGWGVSSGLSASMAWASASASA